MTAPAPVPSFLTVFRAGQEETLRGICARIGAGTATPDDVKKLSAAALVLLGDRAGAEEYFREAENTNRHLFLHANREHLPLEALQWIVRVSRGEEPPYSPEHLEALTWLRDAGGFIGALSGALAVVLDALRDQGIMLPPAVQVQLKHLDVSEDLQILRAKAEPELVAAGLR